MKKKNSDFKQFTKIHKNGIEKYKIYLKYEGMKILIKYANKYAPKMMENRVKIYENW